MKRCDYCGGKLGLIVHRKWRWRFCKLACKQTYECRQREQARRRWLAYLPRFAGRSLHDCSQHGIGGSPKLDHSYTSALRSGLLAFNLTSDPFAVCFATTASFRRYSISTRAAKLNLSPSGLRFQTSPFLTSKQFLPGTSIMLGSWVMSKLLVPALGACASIWASASARAAQHFCQLLAPAVDVSPLSNGVEIAGIGARLAQEGRAMLDNDTVAARTLRSNQLPDFSNHAPLFLRLRQGGLW
jgi:hypothetical protein